ncbi:MAG: Glucitol operon repressor [Verrucomicrobiae bacterium]|nr:Glucitol operon repressor [Verrucomicrobiae bacterium]
MHSRHHEIIESLQAGRSVSVARLAARFRVTPATIRRDLDELQAAGRLERTHGGAVLSKPGQIEFRLRRREEVMAAAKKAIAAAAAGLVSPGMSVTLDTGTTTLEVARALSGIENLRVLTSSLAVAAALHPFEGIRLTLLGGEARRNEPDLFGELTEENLRRFRVDIAFIGADRVTPDGLFTNSPEVARVSQAMIRGAQQCVLVADSSKFGTPSFYHFSSWDNIHTVVTDTGLKDRRWVTRNAKLILAKP